MLVIIHADELKKRHAEWLSLATFCNPIPLDQAPGVRDAVPGGAEWAGTIQVPMDTSIGCEERPAIVAGGKGGLAIGVDLGLEELKCLYMAADGNTAPGVDGPDPLPADVTVLGPEDMERHADVLLPLLAAAQPVAPMLLPPEVVNAIRATTSLHNTEDMFASAWGSCLAVDGTPVYFAGPHSLSFPHNRHLIVSAPAELVAQWFGETVGKAASNGKSRGKRGRKAVTV